MNTTNWSTNDIPPQTGRRAVVTGTGGLGYETALALAAKGTWVVLAGRNETKGAESVKKILAEHPRANIRFEQLDLASLKSAEDFAQRLIAEDRPLDLLVNNAGVMALPKRRTTQDGFEMQFGTNHLGHFALTAHLLPLLLRGNRPRVVNVSSSAHLQGRMHFEDLQGEHSYKPWAFYCQSKLANILFTLELQRRSDANGWGLMANSAHPGYALTDLIPNGPGAGSFMSKLSGTFLAPWLGQSPAAGALPTLMAATDPEAKGPVYYGPNGLFGMKGPPAPAKISKRGLDAADAAKLWEISESLTGIHWPEKELVSV